MPAPTTNGSPAGCHPRTAEAVSGQGGGASAAFRRARRDVPRPRLSALSAAIRLLASTAEAIGPDTPANELLAYLTRYRAHLSALVTASRPATPPTYGD